MRDINSMSRVNALAPNRRNSVPFTVRTFRPRLCTNWDLEHLDLLNGLALDCYQPSPEVLIVLYSKLTLYIYWYDEEFN